MAEGACRTASPVRAVVTEFVQFVPGGAAVGIVSA